MAGPYLKKCCQTPADAPHAPKCYLLNKPKPPVITPADLFNRVGRALFGEHWKGDMARALRLRRANTVDDLASGRSEPSPGIWRDLVTEIEGRERELGLLKIEALKLAGPRTDGGVDVQGPHYPSNTADSIPIDSAYRAPDGRQTAVPSGPRSPRKRDR